MNPFALVVGGFCLGVGFTGLIESNTNKGLKILNIIFGITNIAMGLV
jgi:hypothetical protein